MATLGKIYFVGFLATFIFFFGMGFLGRMEDKESQRRLPLSGLLYVSVHQAAGWPAKMFDFFIYMKRRG